MSSETIAEPASTREPLTLIQGADRISGLLNPNPPAAVEPSEPVEPEPVAPEVAEPPQVQDTSPDVGMDAPQDVKVPTEGSPEDAQDELTLEPAQLASLLGMEEDAIGMNDDGALSVRVKIDGKHGTATLKDLRDSYQLAKTSQQRLQQLGEERKAFDDERKTILESLTNQTATLELAAKKLEDEFTQDFQSVDWQALRTDDPTEYNAKRLDYEDRRRRMEGYKQEVQALQYQAMQQQESRRMQLQSEGRQRLADVFQGPEYSKAPAWGPDEQRKLFDWIISQGFDAEEVNRTPVWQIFKWARDSMLREQELATARESVKQVLKLPKVTKPGPAKPAKQVSRSKLDELKKRQRKMGGSLSSTADLISEIRRM